MSRNVEHQFFCIKCGQAGIPILRNRGFQHSSLHRKKLYCPWCKIEINHIECKDDNEIYEFKKNWRNGIYINEIEESINICKNKKGIDNI